MDLDDENAVEIDTLSQQPALKVRSSFVDKRQEEAAYFDNLLSQHLPASIRSWTCNEYGWTFEFQDVVVTINHGEAETCSAHASSETINRRTLDEMREQLRALLLDLTEIDLTAIGFAVKLLEVCEAAEAWQAAWHDELRERDSRRQGVRLLHSRGRESVGGWDAKQVQNWGSILDNPAGVDLSSVQEDALHLLHQPIEKLCSKISEDLRILHVEPVFRNDLVQRFLDRQASIRRHLLRMPYGALRHSVSPTAIPRGSRDDNLEGLANELCRQHVTYHGAPHRVTQSIVRYGFVLPGEGIGKTGQLLDVRCGSTFGKGIYSSPDPMYASAYLDYDLTGRDTITQPADVPGMRLFVCATLMGRPILGTKARGSDHLLSDHAHSHVSPNQLEYVVFDSAQIIPVYVLHLDYGAEHARKEFDRMNSNPKDYFWRRRQAIKAGRVEMDPTQCPGDVQRKKQALKAAAAKWFPYGYG